jgi:DNA-binding MarR family transcriptional regulator
LEQEPIARLIVVARRRLNQASTRAARGFGLNSPRLWLVVHLREFPGLSLRALAQRLRMDEPTASRIISSLMDRKLVRSSRDPHDRRRNQLELTAQGMVLADRLVPVAAGIRAAAEGGLTSDEKATLRRLLHQVIENMENFQRDLTRTTSARQGSPRPLARRARRVTEPVPEKTR